MRFNVTGGRENKLKQTTVNQGNTSNEVDILSDENDVSLMRKCQRKMSQTITSIQLSVPIIDRRRNSIQLKVSETSCCCNYFLTTYEMNKFNRHFAKIAFS